MKLPFLLFLLLVCKIEPKRVRLCLVCVGRGYKVIVHKVYEVVKKKWKPPVGATRPQDNSPPHGFPSRFPAALFPLKQANSVTEHKEGWDHVLLKRIAINQKVFPCTKKVEILFSSTELHLPCLSWVYQPSEEHQRRQFRQPSYRGQSPCFKKVNPKIKVSHQKRKKKVSTRLPSRSLQELPWLPQSCPHRSHPSVGNVKMLRRWDSPGRYGHF